MKTLKLFVTVIVTVLWLFTACTNTVNTPELTDTNTIKKEQNSNKSSQKVIHEEALKVALVNAFGVEGSKGKITASAVADYIAQKKGTVEADGFSFNGCIVTAYDDKTGTFTVEAKGTKGGKVFTKSCTYSGFTHPYDSALSSVEGSLNLDSAIENNYSVKKFVEELTADASMKTKVLQDITFRLDNGKTVETGKYADKGYAFVLSIEENTGSEKISQPIMVKPIFTVIYKTLTAGQSETVTRQTKNGRFLTGQNYAYFTEQDVCEYLADKVTERSFTVDTNTFASYYYAFATAEKGTKQMPDVLYAAQSEIDRYVEKYTAPKTADTHLKIDGLQLGFYAGSIPTADDRTGVLTFTAAVGSAANLQNGMRPIGIKEITLTGFNTLNIAEEFTQKYFSFNVIKLGAKKRAEVKEEYLKAQVSTVLYQPERANPFERNPWKQSSTTRSFFLDVPEYDENLNTLTTTDGEHIYIEGISIKKERGVAFFELSVILKSHNSTPLTVKVTPYSLIK